jgi:HSP20 family protein
MHPLFSEERSDLFTKPSGMPPPDILEAEDELRINIPVAGYTKDLIDVNVEDGTLIISAKRKILYEKDEKITFIKRNISLGGFEWKLKLNSVVDTESITAELVDGILFVSLPKKQKEVKKIEVT